VEAPMRKLDEMEESLVNMVGGKPKNMDGK